MSTRINYKHILFAILFFGIIYFVIWILFMINGPFQIGEDLNKSDWLIFSGGYLSFVGTISITYMVIIQNKNYHSMEQERMRYSQLPYIRIKLANVKEDLKLSNGGYLLDFPSLVNDNNRFIWKGRETGVIAICPAGQAEHEAIYKVQNIGLGHAMKFSLHSSDSDYNFRDHLKTNDSLFFRIDLASLKRETQKIILHVKFYDVYNNKYQQKLLCEFIFDGTNFKFDIAQEQFEPELIKS